MSTLQSKASQSKTQVDHGCPDIEQGQVLQVPDEQQKIMRSHPTLSHKDRRLLILWSIHSSRIRICRMIKLRLIMMLIIKNLPSILMLWRLCKIKIPKKIWMCNNNLNKRTGSRDGLGLKPGLYLLTSRIWILDQIISKMH